MSRLNPIEITHATSGATPAAIPMPITTKMPATSLLSSSDVRNRTAATMPPSEKASANDVFTITTIAAATTGRISEVCTTDCWKPFLRRVSV